MREASKQAGPRPFLKWAGGKGQLLDELRPCVERSAWRGRYHEPFMGGAALFFDLYRRKLLGKKTARLSDTNVNLVEAYIGVQQHLEDLIVLLREHKARHTDEYFYEVRQQAPDTLVQRAARLIYLNKTCFNGLYRENSRGVFNVPLGRYKNPLILDEPNLRAVSAALQRTEIAVRPFDHVLNSAQPGDLVYFDPPYDPVSATANFTAYAKGGFGKADQLKLRDVFVRLGEQGVFALLSNSYTDFILEAYQGIDGIVVEEVLATRHVNSRADRRGKVSEVLVNNFQRAKACP